MISDIHYLFTSTMSILKIKVVLFGYSFTFFDLFIISFFIGVVCYLICKVLDY